MTRSSRHGLIASEALLVSAMVGLGLGASACTPATVDSESVASGGDATAGSSPATSTSGSGSGGSPSSSVAGGAGSPSSGGSEPDGTGGSLPSGGAGGVAGSGGQLASGGSSGAAATGCNWVHATDDTWSMNPNPADKIVLFDGTDLSQWHRLNEPTVPAQWKVLPDGTMQVVPQATPTNIQTNMKFDDLCVHVEYMTPIYPSGVDVQMQGNSGVYLKSAYEMQILDTHNLPPLIDGCGAVYKVSAPLVVACHQYLVWNTYEIEFKSSVWNQSTPPVKIKDAVYVQSVLNGLLVQKNVDLNPPGGFTQAGIPDAAGPQPLALQDHRDLVSFRNVWVTVPHY
jgi:hypothetical protein